MKTEIVHDHWAASRRCPQPSSQRRHSALDRTSHPGNLIERPVEYVPWNPMAIEQRIGRIDRIGQQREVFVFKLVTRGTLEEQVLQLLDEKISMFELVVGEVGAILGTLEEDHDFADLMLDAWLRTTETSRHEAFDALGHRLHEAKQHHEIVKALDESLFGEDFEAA